MRWLLALSLAACSTSRGDDPGKERAELLRQLRGAEGHANLVADGRHYMAKPEALQPEIRAFTTALADALAAEGGSGHHPPWVTGREPVIAEPWLERGLRVNAISIAAWKQGSATLYQVSTGSTIEVVRATPAVDAAWQRLADAARARAAFTDVFGPVTDLPPPGSRGIDARGTSSMAEPAVSPR